MSNTNSNSNVLIPLSKNQKRAVTIGGVCLMFSIAMFGVGFAVIQGPILDKMNALNYYSLITIFASLGLSITTPIGGKLGDLFGRRNIIVISGILCALFGIGMGLVRSVVPFVILRLALSAAQGAFTAAPYILMREINEAKDVPKSMGLLASSIAIGGFGGSILLGALADANQLEIAIMIPVIPLIIGIILIAVNLPNKKKSSKVDIDIPGIICLAVLLTSFSLSMNFGATIGWGNIKIIFGLVLTIIALILFVKIENKSTEPIVPMYLFKNKNYAVLLIVGFICYFYQTAMNAYAPLAVQKVLGLPVAISGSLQLPRTILTMILPTIIGVWVGKKTKNIWMAMAFASGIIAVAFLPLGFTTPSTSIIIYFVAISLTGLAESFRSVSVTPAAQATLKPQDLGVGTALVTFVNSLASLFSSVIYGAVFGMNPDSVQTGINSIFLLTVAVSIVGLVLVILVVRKNIQNQNQSDPVKAE